MIELPTAPTSASPPADGEHPRELLRRALGDLGTLSGELSSAEAALEHDRAAKAEAILKAAERDGWDLEERGRKLRTAATTEHDQRLKQVAQHRDAAIKAAKDAQSRSVLHAKRNFEDQQAEIKKAIEEAEWLADSLLEGAEGAARRHAIEAKDAFEKSIKDLDERQNKAIETLATYSQQHLILAPAPPPSPLETDIDERHARKALADELAKLTASQKALDDCELAKTFVGVMPYIVGTVVVGLGAILGQLTTMSMTLHAPRVTIGAIVAFVIACGLGVFLKAVANRRVKAILLPLRQQLEDARVWVETINRLTAERITSDLQAARLKREEEVRSIRAHHAPMLAKLEATARVAVLQADADYKAALSVAESQHTRELTEVNAALEKKVADLDARYARETEAVRSRSAAEQAKAGEAYEQGKASLQARWQQGLGRIASATHLGTTVPGTAPLIWNLIDWKTWQPSTAFPPAIRFGELAINVTDLTAPPQTATEASGEPTAQQTPTPAPTWRFDGLLPERFKVPAMLAFGIGASSQASSLMLDFDRPSRDLALSALRATTARLLATMPAGRVRLTMIDPVGLGQTFAGFMHLADYDEQLTGPRIWTDTETIDRRISDLTDHMETVIQKYLRNEFETIDAYNAQAGELAEPYRFLVVADFPTSFSPEALNKLSSILHAGARCGVHVLLARDTRVQIERRVIEDVRAGTTVVSLVPPKKPQNPLEVPPPPDSVIHPVWQDPVFAKFPLSLDPEPDDSALTELCKAVGEGARRANRVQVDFNAVLPPIEQRWTGSTAAEFKVPVGRSGATRLQQLKLGKGVSQHALLAGKTGSGKSTLLHVMVTAGAMWFSPAEVEFYLIDFKKGVEFKAYVDGRLPHARAVAIESDREFGLSVLQRLDAELSRRGELFRAAGVQDLPSYRETPNPQVLPRTLLVVDEFQEYFSEDDKLAQEASSLLDRLVRQGRAFGMHVLLGSQTIGGSAGLPRSTLGQMAVRVALQCSEADSTMILGESNTAARLLTRPGEAIYNDNGGLPEANSPFQVAWLADEKRDHLLAEIATEAAKRNWPYNAVVFEGNKPVDPTTHQGLLALLQAPPAIPTSILGEPVAIKPATRVPFRRQPGANVLLIGQQEEAAMATLQAALLSLAHNNAKFIVLEGTNADSPLKGSLAHIPTLSPTDSAPDTSALQYVDYREVDAAIASAHEELQSRLADPDAAASAPPLFIIIYALQRYRTLRKSGDDYSFSMSSDEPKKLSPDKQLAEIVKEGPSVGIHLIAWADTLVSIERVFDRALMREFDHRILFQMSASDSSALIDAPTGNRLGAHRALLFSEEQGILEKFRPFALFAMPTQAK